MKGWVISLFIMALLVVSSCGNINQSEKRACEKSGGEYSTGFSETYGQFSYCECPTGLWENDKHICQSITQEEISQCISLNNENVNCNNNGLVCECKSRLDSFNKTMSTIEYKDLKNCACKCYDDSCVCGRCGVKK